MRSVILTSATLAADDSIVSCSCANAFGIPKDAPSNRLDTPFDYQTQAKLIVNQAALIPTALLLKKPRRNGLAII